MCAAKTKSCVCVCRKMSQGYLRKTVPRNNVVVKVETMCFRQSFFPPISINHRLSLPSPQFRNEVAETEKLWNNIAVKMWDLTSYLAECRLQPRPYGTRQYFQSPSNRKTCEFSLQAAKWVCWFYNCTHSIWVSLLPIWLHYSSESRAQAYVMYWMTHSHREQHMYSRLLNSDAIQQQHRKSGTRALSCINFVILLSVILCERIKLNWRHRRSLAFNSCIWIGNHQIALVWAMSAWVFAD